MSDDLIYEERISSPRTKAVFVALSVFCLAFFAWRLMISGYGGIAALLLFLSAFFVFCALNYSVLSIRISTAGMNLKFGLFGWTVPWRSVAEAHVDEVSLWRICGAGIHFAIIRGRYRAMLNFLEYPRIVIQLKEKRGLVRDVAFSTKRPAEILGIIEQHIPKQHAAQQIASSLRSSQ